MFHSYFERKNDKVITFTIVHLSNFETSKFLRAPILKNICEQRLLDIRISCNESQVNTSKILYREPYIIFNIFEHTEHN